MKKIILIILVFIISFGFSKLNSNKEIVFSIKKGKELKENNQLYQMILASLKNISKDTLYYASMSCSWQNLYYFENQKLDSKITCDKNSPIAIRLKPGEIKTVAFKFIKSNKISDNHFKLAFNFIKLKSKTDYINHNLIGKANNYNLIYSNVVSFE